MNRNKKLFVRKTNRYFNHRIGAYNAKTSILKSIVMPSIGMVLVGVGGYVGYDLYKNNLPALSNNNQPSLIQPKETLSQEQIDQKALEAREDEVLVGAIKGKIKEMPEGSEWQVSVRDLKSGRMANINSDTPMTSASLSKLFLLAPLEKRISADNWKSYIGRQSINDCVTVMIRVSDNDCAKLIGNYVGWRNVDSHNQSLGFMKTKLNIDNGQVTTAREVNDVMYRLQNSMILSDKARRLVFDALYSQKYRDGIATGCGQGCLVASKHGEIDEYKHDAAIVTHESSQYVVVIMTKNAKWSNIAELAKVIDREMLP